MESKDTHQILFKEMVSTLNALEFAVHSEGAEERPTDLMLMERLRSTVFTYASKIKAGDISTAMRKDLYAKATKTLGRFNTLTWSLELPFLPGGPKAPEPTYFDPLGWGRGENTVDRATLIQAAEAFGVTLKTTDYAVQAHLENRVGSTAFIEGRYWNYSAAWSVLKVLAARWDEQNPSGEGLYNPVPTEDPFSLEKLRKLYALMRADYEYLMKAAIEEPHASARLVNATRSPNRYPKPNW